MFAKMLMKYKSIKDTKRLKIKKEGLTSFIFFKAIDAKCQTLFIL